MQCVTRSDYFQGELDCNDTPDGLQAKLKGAGELELCVKGTAAQLKTLLSNLDGVGKLYDDRSRRWNRARQVSEKADAISASRCFMSWQRIGCPCLAMEKKTGSLEDIFLQLTDKPEEETKQ